MLPDWLRRILHRGPRRERRHPPRSSPRPKAGEFVARQNLMMRITQTVPGELWDWMLANGWRGVDPFKDRRHYVLVHHEAFVELLRADIFSREAQHQALIKHYPAPSLTSGPSSRF